MKKEERDVISLIPDNEGNKRIPSLNKGVEFFHEWAGTHLPINQYECLAEELKNFSQVIDYEKVKNQSTLQFPKLILEMMYQAGKEALSGEADPRLADLFSILTHLLPHSYDAWLGLGLAYQKVSQNLESVVAFEQAKNLRPDLFLASLYQAESYLGLKQFSESKKCALEAFQLMGTGDRHFRKYAEHLLNQSKVGVGS